MLSFTLESIVQVGVTKRERGTCRACVTSTIGYNILSSNCFLLSSVKFDTLKKSIECRDLFVSGCGADANTDCILVKNQLVDKNLWRCSVWSGGGGVFRRGRSVVSGRWGMVRAVWSGGGRSVVRER